MDRRTALLSLTSLAAAPVLAQDEAPRSKSPIPGAYPFLSTAKELPIRVASHPVRWQGQDFHLLQFGRARFSISSTGRLVGILSGNTTTFDAVDYDVHVALFDDTGTLLGTASAVASVERIWLGKVGFTPLTLNLDFGISEGYKRGEWFTVGITERKVLTPDDWAGRKDVLQKPEK